MTDTHARLSLTLEHLWQFSLQYYSVREVKEACLKLQNLYHGNVNLLLLLKFLDEQGIAFDQQNWHQVEACLGRSEALLTQYRELRKKMKTQAPDTLYREALQFELLLEKQQQADLVDCINSLPLQETSDPSLTLEYCQQLGAESFYSFFSKPRH